MSVRTLRRLIPLALLAGALAAPSAASAAYRDVVLADNPDAYFRMDDTNATMVNETAAADGTHVISGGGPTFGLGGALTGETPNLSVGYLNNQTDRSAFPFTTDYDDFTIEFFVFSPEPNPAPGVTQWYAGRGLVDGDIPGSSNDAGIAIIQGGHVGFGLGAPDTTIESTTPVNGGAFHHVVATSDGAGLMKLYVDGVLEAQNNSAPIAERTNDGFQVAQLLTPISGDGQLAGAIDELAFYRDALTQADVTEHYNASLPPPSNPGSPASPSLPPASTPTTQLRGGARRKALKKCLANAREIENERKRTTKIRRCRLTFGA